MSLCFTSLFPLLLVSHHQKLLRQNIALAAPFKLGFIYFVSFCVNVISVYQQSRILHI